MTTNPSTPPAWHMRASRIVWTVLAGLLLVVTGALAASAEPAHGIAMQGTLKHPKGFTHFPYVNPDAPKGGSLTVGFIGSFDSLNPFIVKGSAASGLRAGTSGNYIYESLLERAYDEAFSLYGLIAETVEMPPDRSFVAFTLRPEARFSDGTPLTVADVIHSFELLRDKGRPNTRTAYSKVDRIETSGDRSIKFIFKDATDKELPLIIGLMPILPKHAMSAELFEQTSLVPPIGSGPYVVAAVEPGTRVVFKRNPDYWGRDLPVKRGMDNFDEVRLEYFRDQTSLFEAFKKGLIDVYPDGDPNSWSSAYDFPAVRDGRVVKDVIPTGLPKGMNGFVFNTRRPIFADVRVREALAAAFDFEWMNQNLFFGLFRRSGSYFQGSELSALGVPASDAEKALLAPFPNVVRADVMDGTYKPVATDGSGRDRVALRRVIDLLAAAGWTLQGGAMKNAKGEPLTFELLITTRDQERLALAYQRTLKTIGVDLKIRSVESQQYQQRRQMFDFDMTPNLYTASLSPGNEQLTRWGAASADQNGSFNFAGAREPAIDAMIQALLSATDRESFIAATRAYDRVLISGFYVVPLFHLADQWLARWTHIERPDPSLYGSLQITWWRKPAP